MPISVTWWDERQRIILVEMEESWTWAEAQAAVEECFRMIDTVDYRVCSIFDASRWDRVPQNALINLRRLNRYRHPRWWYAAIVGMPFSFKPMFEVYRRFQGFANPYGVFLFETRQEACEFLEQHIATEDQTE